MNYVIKYICMAIFMLNCFPISAQEALQQLRQALRPFQALLTGQTTAALKNNEELKNLFEELSKITIKGSYPYIKNQNEAFKSLVRQLLEGNATDSKKVEAETVLATLQKRLTTFLGTNGQNPQATALPEPKKDLDKALDAAMQQQRNIEEEARKRAIQAQKEEEIRADEQRKAQQAADAAAAQGMNYNRQLLDIINERDQQLKMQYQQMSKALHQAQQQCQEAINTIIKDVDLARTELANCRIQARDIGLSAQQALALHEQKNKDLQKVLENQKVTALNEAKLKELQDQRKACDDIQNQNAQLQEKLRVCEGMTEKASSHALDECQRLEVAHKKQIEELKKNLLSMEKSNAQNKLNLAQLDKTRATNAQLEANLRIATEQLEQLRKENKDLQSAYNSLTQTAQNTQNADIDSAVAQQQLKKLVNEKNTNEEKARESIQQLTIKNAEYAQQIAQLKEQLNAGANPDISARLQKLEARLEKAQNEAEVYNNDAQELDRENQRLIKENEELTKQIKALKPAKINPGLILQ